MEGDETGRKKVSPDTQPMRCTRATDAPWRQGTVTQPFGLPHGHGCAPIKKGYFNLPYLIIYLGVPIYFADFSYNSLAIPSIGL